MHTYNKNPKKLTYNKLGKLLIIDKLFFLLLFFSMLIFSPDMVIIAIFVLTIPYLIMTDRKSLFPQLAIAFLLSFIWVFIANGKYGYANDYVSVFGLNIFPMFGWTVGLFVGYLLFSHYEHIVSGSSFVKKIVIFTLMFSVLLISVETIGYHIFNVRNLTNAAYKGLPFCNCLHAPFWMKIMYFLMGPIFYSVCYYLKLENPHLALKIRSIVPRGSEN